MARCWPPTTSNNRHAESAFLKNHVLLCVCVFFCCCSATYIRKLLAHDLILPIESGGCTPHPPPILPRRRAMIAFLFFLPILTTWAALSPQPMEDLTSWQTSVHYRKYFSKKKTKKQIQMPTTGTPSPRQDSWPYANTYVTYSQFLSRKKQNGKFSDELGQLVKSRAESFPPLRSA